MRICLISNDDALRNMVHEVCPAPFETILPGELPAEADLYIWDGGPPGDTPHGSTNKLHLVLVDRAASSNPTIHYDAARVCVLLKPVNGSTLRAFIELAEGEWWQSQQAARADALKSDRDALLQYVLQANLRLQQYDQDRTNFLARALHDLRAPLTALQGYCALMQEGQFGPINAQQNDLLKRMEHSARRLSRLACGMFELSIKGHVTRKLRLEPGEIEESLQQALYEVSAFVQEKGLGVTAEMEPSPKPFFYDSEQIEQVLVNLLENACKFTPAHGSIQILGYAVERVADGTRPAAPALATAYRVDIRDSGPGMDPARLGLIFEQYTSYAGPRDRSGAGLGLAICKLLMNSHGGRIWAESCAEGAMFSIVLPFEPLTAGAAPGTGDATVIAAEAV